ncbi:ABC transporter ATP-binding protein [Wukongibacter baidiensis]|uniref:ABC transporter ATP-binding protein n=1 Tax=Wukongibacter baidiensis TaxID=1723361 RepID=UPI003D7F8244
MIEIKNLGVKYSSRDGDVTAIKNINLKVPNGDICVIIGPSGGGKSTLLKVLAGIIKDYEGEALVDGREINPKTNRIGFIPQNYGLVKWKTAEENIFLSARIKDGRKCIDIDYYEKILTKLGIRELKNRYPSGLSGGQQQRVSIARAFLLKPNLLLMDEPFSALDAMTREEVQKLFLEVWKESRVTTILVTHDIREAIYLGKRIIILSSITGRILEVIDNPFFGKVHNGLDKKYGQLNNKIIKALRGEGANEIERI